MMNGLSVVGLAVMRLWGDGKSKRYLMLAELELDTCQDQHPCSSVLVCVTVPCCCM